MTVPYRFFLLLVALFGLFAAPLGSRAEGKSAPKGPTSGSNALKIKETTLLNGLVVHEYRLPNGLEVLLVPDRTAPVFTFQAWFRVGSATEKMDPRLKRTGLAHLFEHMMFRGTPKNPDQIFDRKLSAAGAVGLNATTWLDRTNYFQSLPKEGLELVLELESDRMVNLGIDEKLFNAERGAVFGELKMNKDKPIRAAYEELWDLAFTQHPYKFTTMGTEEELKSFTVEDAMYFYRTYYAPNNCTLILLGDIEIGSTLRLVEKYYGNIPSQPIPSVAPPAEPEQKASRSRTVTHPLSTTEILLLGYRIPNVHSPDLPALEAAAGILAYGNGSWLEKELVQGGIATGVSAGPNRLRDPSLFVVSVQLAPGKDPKDAQKILDSNLKKLANGEFSEEELERAKNQYLLSTYGELLSLDRIGRNLGESRVSADNYLRDFEILAQVRKVDKAAVQAAVKKHLVARGLSAVRVVPAPKKGIQK
jgi:zinc protease